MPRFDAGKPDPLTGYDGSMPGPPRRGVRLSSSLLVPMTTLASPDSWHERAAGPGARRAVLALALLLFVPALGTFAPPAAEGADEGAPHLRLLATSPAADTVVTEPPGEVRLWFSEAPQMQGTAVRLADARGELVPTTDATEDDEDSRQVFIRPRAPLGPGEYTVHWRVIAQDGHAQNGTFGFELRSP
jgi:copper resistance protein C